MTPTKERKTARLVDSIAGGLEATRAEGARILIVDRPPRCRRQDAVSGDFDAFADHRADGRPQSRQRPRQVFAMAELAARRPHNLSLEGLRPARRAVFRGADKSGRSGKA